MSKAKTLNAEAGTIPANLRTCTTGTVHATGADGTPLCPTRISPEAMETTTAAVTCKSCLKLGTEAAPVQAPANIVALTDDQLDGVACVRCGGTGAPMVPAGFGERGQVFECTHHDDTPTCPTWCDAEHNAVNVEHVSDQHVQETPRGDVGVQLRRDPAGRPRIALATFRHQECELGEAELTLADAEILAMTLLARVAAARSI